MFKELRKLDRNSNKPIEKLKLSFDTALVADICPQETDFNGKWLLQAEKKINEIIERLT